MTKLIATVAGLAVAGSAFAQLDGQNIPTDAANNGLTLLATQDTPTSFGDATGGGQDSAGGGELNQLWASLSGTTLNLSITGNIEGNFNKLWIFFDGATGGESVLSNNNSDGDPANGGGFGEINNLAGLGFSGATMDRALKIEVGGGFWGIRYTDLINDVDGDIATGGGPGDLPLSNVAGNLGVNFGWDNSNVLGVTGSDASTASTATTGFEFSIDLLSFFGEIPSEVNITAFYGNQGGDFLSNQVLPGIGGGGNLEAPGNVNLGFVTIPAPGATGLLALAGLAAARRRRA